jgi:hypothetical protein
MAGQTHPAKLELLQPDNLPYFPSLFDAKASRVVEVFDVTMFSNSRATFNAFTACLPCQGDPRSIPDVLE